MEWKQFTIFLLMHLKAQQSALLYIILLLLKLLGSGF